MRLFVAIDIAPGIREKLAQFRDTMKPLAPSARWVGAETFHITLKFIGERPPQQAEAIKRALAAVQAASAGVRFRGAGFFPNPRSARVFWVGIEADEHLAQLAQDVDNVLSNLPIFPPIAPEERPYAPHLTLARSGDMRHPRGGSGRPQARPDDRPNSRFAALQEKLAAMPEPDFGAMLATEFFLYESKLSPTGAHYTKLARFPLGADAEGSE